MDSFEQCRLASEKAAWSYEKELKDLEFDFALDFLPKRLCGAELPPWLKPDERRLLNQIRAFSYAHIFLFVEQFIVEETCAAALAYVRTDREALSALLKFTDEETKHQRMFLKIKDQVAAGLGFRPGELEGMKEMARKICSHSSFAVFLVTLNIEWFTQRHYVECFQAEKGILDAGFVKVFRLHWTEEAQHARIDTLQLQRLAKTLSAPELLCAYDEFWAILSEMRGLIREQDRLDVASFESGLGRSLSDQERASLLLALEKCSLWTYFLSGLEHQAFAKVYNALLPPGGASLEWVKNKVVQL
jgi:hypothetical protein